MSFSPVFTWSVVSGYVEQSGKFDDRSEHNGQRISTWQKRGPLQPPYEVHKVLLLGGQRAANSCSQLPFESPG